MNGKLTLVTSLSELNKTWLDTMGIDYEEVAPLRIHPVLVKVPLTLAKNVPILISSRYAIDQIQKQGILLSDKRIFAVGTTTSTLAKDVGLHIQKTFNYLTDLASWLHGQGEHELVHLSGDLSVPGIESVFETNKVVYTRIVLYKKEICHPLLGPVPRTILFFSPSGVDSVKDKNEMDSRHFYGAIGRTTRDALSQIGVNVSFMPDEPNFNSFVLSAIHFLKG